MKQFLLPGFVVLGFMSFDISAQTCAPSPSNRINSLQNLLPGRTVCAVRGAEKWQEQHRGSGTSGELWDYKKGPSDPVDPTKQLGTWSIGGPANRQITYVYSAFGDPTSYSFEVYNVGGAYNFCGIDGNSDDLIGAAILPGIVACPE